MYVSYGWHALNERDKESLLHESLVSQPQLYQLYNIPKFRKRLKATG